MTDQAFRDEFPDDFETRVERIEFFARQKFMEAKQEGFPTNVYLDFLPRDQTVHNLPGNYWTDENKLLRFVKKGTITLCSM